MLVCDWLIMPCIIDGHGVYPDAVFRNINVFKVNYFTSLRYQDQTNSTASVASHRDAGNGVMESWSIAVHILMNAQQHCYKKVCLLIMRAL